MNLSAFISAEKAFEKHQNKEDVIFLDATYGQPVEYTIPGAIRFDIDDIADPESSMAHMLPTSEIFAEKIGSMGIDNDTEIIVFDKTGFWMAASRVWWMFRAFGHSNIKILNGGLSQWPGELDPYALTQTKSKIFNAKHQKQLIVNFDDIQKAKISDDYIIVDARPMMAFMTGHIKNSTSIPLPKIIDDKGGIKKLSDLHQILLPATGSGKKIITSCGSGVTACALAVAFYECGIQNVAVYDGSWSEYSKLKAA